jgi:hypothetical protein
MMMGLFPLWLWEMALVLMMALIIWCDKLEAE